MRLQVLRRQVASETQIAAKHGLSPVSFAIRKLLEDDREEDDQERTELDEEVKLMSLRIEGRLNNHKTVVDWQSNLEVQREMRRDIKWELRSARHYTSERLEELASLIVDLTHRRSES